MRHRAKKKDYVVVKIGRQNSTQGVREAWIYKYIQGILKATSHPGAVHIRSMLDSFQLELEGSSYYGLVHDPHMVLQIPKLLQPNTTDVDNVVTLRHGCFGMSSIYSGA